MLRFSECETIRNNNASTEKISHLLYSYFFSSLHRLKGEFSKQGVLDMGGCPLVSIIIPVKNEGMHLQNTLESLFTVQTNAPFDVIVVNDHSVDHCCDFLQTYEHKNKVQLLETAGVGAANARNIGADAAAGDILIFCDAHLEFQDLWLERLIEPLLDGSYDAVTPAIGTIGSPEIVGYGQSLQSNLKTVWNERKGRIVETAVVPGGCFAIKRDVFHEIEGFDRGFKTWGYEDVELSIKLWLFGYKACVRSDVVVLHLFRTSHPYPLRHEDYYYNFLRMAYLHFTPLRIKKCKTEIGHLDIKKIETRVLAGDVMKKREQYAKKRKFDDDWYFRKFAIPF